MRQLAFDDDGARFGRGFAHFTTFLMVSSESGWGER
jgi:hypothetical protein